MGRDRPGSPAFRNLTPHYRFELRRIPVSCDTGLPEQEPSMDIDSLTSYTRQYWSEAKDTHVADPAYYQLAETQLRGIVERNLASGANVLDIGCGNGEYTRLLAARAQRVLAFDISDSLLAAARARCREFDNTFFLQADVANTKLAFGQQAHAVFCMGLFACLPDDAQVLRLLRDFADYLVNDGLLVLRESTMTGPQQYIRYASGHLGCYRNKQWLLESLRSTGFELQEEIPLKAQFEPFNDYLVLRKRRADQAGAAISDNR